MTITDGGEAAVAPTENAVFDAVADDPRLDSATSDKEAGAYSWPDLLEIALAWDKQVDGLKLAILTIGYLAEGKKGWAVDEQALADTMGRKRNTIKSFLRTLYRKDFLILDAAVNDKDRPTFIYRTKFSVS